MRMAVLVTAIAAGTATADARAWIPPLDSGSRQRRRPTPERRTLTHRHVVYSGVGEVSCHWAGAAVEVDGRAGDVGAACGEQERGQIGEFGSEADPAQRDLPGGSHFRV